MELIDTHTHIYDEAFDADRLKTIERAENAGVVKMLLPAIDEESHTQQEQLYQSRPDLFCQMMGLHPTSVNADFEKRLDITRQLLFNNPNYYVGIGEIGLDLYWDTTFKEQQIEVLKQQIAWAKQLNKPIVLHVRNAHTEILQLLNELNYAHYEGILHCFGGTIEQAQQAIDMGFHIGVGGVVTFKKSLLVQVVEDTPIERIVLETDSPYLAPVPYRGKRNESAFIVEVAKKVAEIKQMSLEGVAEQTTFNAKKLFNI